MKRENKKGYEGETIDVVSGLGFVECANGHKSAKLTRGRDRERGLYLEARCVAPDCGLRQRIYDRERRDDAD